MEISKLSLAMQELKMTIDEAKNLCLSGRVVQCYNKLQGAQVRCQNIFALLYQKNEEEKTDVVQPNS